MDLYRWSFWESQIPDHVLTLSFLGDLRRTTLLGHRAMSYPSTAHDCSNLAENWGTCHHAFFPQSRKPDWVPQGCTCGWERLPIGACVGRDRGHSKGLALGKRLQGEEGCRLRWQMPKWSSSGLTVLHWTTGKQRGSSKGKRSSQPQKDGQTLLSWKIG